MIGPYESRAPHEEVLARGLRLFHEGLFFEAHEVWEEVWTATDGPERVPLQGLIQIAAAAVHLSRGGVPPASRLLDAGLEKLDSGGGIPLPGLDPASLRSRAAEARNRLRAGDSGGALASLRASSLPPG